MAEENRYHTPPLSPGAITGAASQALAETAGAVVRLRRQIFDLHAVFDIARRFHSVLDTDALLDGILLTAIGQLGVGAAAVAVATPGEHGRLSQCKWKGWPDADKLDWTVALNSPLANLLIACRGPMLVDETVRSLPAESPDGDRLRLMECRLIAPLVSRSDLRGVLYLPAKLTGEQFSDGDVQFLGLLLEQLSVSLDNALLYKCERETAQELLQTRERLAQAEKLAALGHLSATVAHEVNNPLGIIKNYIQLLKPAISHSEDATDKLELIRREVDRLTLFVRQLLGAFQPDQSHGGSVAVIPLLEEIMRFVAPELAAHRIEVRTSFPDSPSGIWAGSDPLRSVFLNLALNARDAMPDGGRLTVAVAEDHPWVEVRFTDEGSGIDPAVADALFDPFVTTKDGETGTGLGLSVCQSIVEGYGGSISAENLPPPRQGAVFRVRLRTTDPEDHTTKYPERATLTSEER